MLVGILAKWASLLFFVCVVLIYVNSIVLDPSFHFLCLLSFVTCASRAYLPGVHLLCVVRMSAPYLATDPAMDVLIASKAPSLQQTSLCRAPSICAYSYFSKGQMALRRLLRDPLFWNSHPGQPFSIFQPPAFCQTSMCIVISRSFNLYLSNC